MKLLFSALTKFVIGIVLVGALLFLPAGTIEYEQAWLLLGVLFIPMIMLGAVLLIKSPGLLAKRLNNKEKQRAQKGVVGISALMFLATFIVSALDFRFVWSHVPFWTSVVASVVFLIGYGIYAEVMRENAYLSRTIEVQENQKVISTGMYKIVRHPMYLATLLMFLPMPIILGSIWGLIPTLIYPIAIIIRIKNEEKLLSAELDGYEEYKTKTKYRLIPFIW
ncbi:MAG: isoprenylcysteine carboxylmethyltransferase family protein [Clostridia bacterium]|nr:isoprenylcysteine carboxylmethyltransferase family protein [Clostridia bacterium]